jgi:hypothetical protein
MSANKEKAPSQGTRGRENEPAEIKVARPAAKAFTFFPRDYLGWQGREWMTPAQRGDLFDLVAVAVDEGTGSLPKNHPIFDRIDPVVMRLAVVSEGDRFAVREPFDLPTLLGHRRAWIDGKIKGGEESANSRRTKTGTAQPKGSRVRRDPKSSSERPEVDFGTGDVEHDAHEDAPEPPTVSETPKSTSADTEHDLPFSRTARTERNGTDRQGGEDPFRSQNAAEARTRGTSDDELDALFSDPPEGPEAPWRDPDTERR